jgi:hypothetical protein
MLSYKATESTRIQDELNEYVWGVKLMDSVKVFHFSAFVDRDCWTERNASTERIAEIESADPEMPLASRQMSISKFISSISFDAWQTQS